MSEQPAPVDELLGSVIDGRYVIDARLGGGASGTVYRARHAKVGRAFAVKVLHARFTDSAKMIERFDREATLGARLRHPNVIGVVDSGELAGGGRYMVFELGQGPDLAQVMARGALGDARSLNLARQLLRGLAHAHGLGLVHRDLKPENVIVELDPEHGTEIPRIVDFGLAFEQQEAMAEAGRSGSMRLTTDGLVLGTPAYMAPEQATAQDLDHRTDLFALGVMIYEFLAGKLPFDGDGVALARANLTRTPPPIVERARGLIVDALLEAFAHRLMAKRPGGRFNNATEALAILDLIDRDREAAGRALGVEPSPRAATVTVSSTPIEVEPDDAIEPVARSHRGWVAAALVALVVGVAGLVAWAMSSSTLHAGTPAALAATPSESLPINRVRAVVFEPPGPTDPITPLEPSAPSVPSTPPGRPTPIAPVVKPPVVAEPTSEDVARAYVASGTLLHKLEGTSDRVAVDALWMTYRRIHLARALATPASRKAVMAELADLDTRARAIPARPRTPGVP